MYLTFTDQLLLTCATCDRDEISDLYLCACPLDCQRFVNLSVVPLFVGSSVLTAWTKQPYLQEAGRQISGQVADALHIGKDMELDVQRSPSQEESVSGQVRQMQDSLQTEPFRHVQTLGALVALHV